MATVKKSKKKIIIPICIVLVIAIAGGSIFGITKSKKGKEVTLYTISTGDIYENVSLTGTVSAGTTKEYKVAGVATVKEVFVNVGDKVKKGDVLASFNADTFDSQINSLQASYNESLNSYNRAVSEQKAASVKAKQLEKQIKKLQKQVGKLEQQMSTTKAATKATTKPTKPAKPTTKPTSTTTTTTTTTAAPSSSLTAPTLPSTTNPAQAIEDLTEELKKLNDSIAKITDDLETMSKAMDAITGTIAKVNGKVESGELAVMIYEALIESGITDEMAKKIVDSIDVDALAKTISESDAAKLSAAELQLMSLEAQYTLCKVQADGTTVLAQKKALDATKKALDAIKTQKAEMEKGWVAAFDGTITQLDLTEGLQTTAITTGLTLENLDAMAITVSLGEYDLHRVKVGMKATITTAFGTYDGEVASIAPTATGGSNSSLLDNVGSMAGISGLSSLTASGAGVECVISIPEADENIVAGFDADVQIETGEYLGVTVVPIESIKLEKTGSYVYVYNEEDKTVTKTIIETGAVSDSFYEVKSGLKAGDRIIAAPEANYEEDTFKVKVVTK